MRMLIKMRNEQKRTIHYFGGLEGIFIYAAFQKQTHRQMHSLGFFLICFFLIHHLIGSTCTTQASQPIVKFSSRLLNTIPLTCNEAVYLNSAAGLVATQV